MGGRMAICSVLQDVYGMFRLSEPGAHQRERGASPGQASRAPGRGRSSMGPVPGQGVRPAVHGTSLFGSRHVKPDVFQPMTPARQGRLDASCMHV